MANIIKDNIKKPLSVKIFIGYLFILVIINFIDLLTNFNMYSLTIVIASIIIIYGLIKRIYWIWIFSIISFLFSLVFNIYFLTPFLLGMSRYILINFIFNLGSLLLEFFLPSFFIILYLISIKNYFKNLETGTFEKVMTIFLITAILLSLLSIYQSYSPDKFSESEECGEWSASYIMDCECDGEFIDVCPDRNCFAWVNRCYGKCGECKCYSDDIEDYPKNKLITLDDGNEYHRSKKWVEVSCKK